MKETAKEIFEALKGFGAKVERRQNYTIRVTVPAERLAEARGIVWEVYSARPHSWLMVSVNGDYLPLSATVVERPAV